MIYGYTTVLLAIQPCLIQLFLLSYRLETPPTQRWNGGLGF